jgi:hypothetical protein
MPRLQRREEVDHRDHLGGRGDGVGRHLAQRLVAEGEPVVDVPAKLSARVRVFSTGHGRKTDAIDAHAVAVAALRTAGLRPVRVDDAMVALRLVADRRDELGAARTAVNRLLMAVRGRRRGADLHLRPRRRNARRTRRTSPPGAVSNTVRSSVT